MPIKRGNGGRRGIPKGLEKLVKKQQPGGSSNNLRITSRRGKSLAALTLAKLAASLFSFIIYIAWTCHVIPMRYENGLCSLMTGKVHKFYHYSILFFLFARIANIFYICSWLVFQDFQTTTLMCVTILTFFFLCLSLGLSSILISKETVQLVNTWRQILQVLKEAGGRHVGIFENVTLSIKAVGLGASVLLCPLILSALPLVYWELPVSIYYQTKQCFPDLPDFWTQLLCFPFEMITWLFANLIMALGTYVLIISIGLIHSLGQYIRRLPLNTAGQHQKMTEIYQFFKVLNAILNVWYKVVTPPAFFVASSTIVIFLYITFRHTELPIYVYCFYPYSAVVILFIQFGLCYDGFVVINGSEEIVSRLRSRHTKCFSRMCEQDRAIGLRWGKATRPIIVNVGSFTTFNIGVPISRVNFLQSSRIKMGELKSTTQMSLRLTNSNRGKCTALEIEFLKASSFN